MNGHSYAAGILPILFAARVQHYYQLGHIVYIHTQLNHRSSIRWSFVFVFKPSTRNRWMYVYLFSCAFQFTTWAHFFWLVCEYCLAFLTIWVPSTCVGVEAFSMWETSIINPKPHSAHRTGTATTSAWLNLQPYDIGQRQFCILVCLLVILRSLIRSIFRCKVCISFVSVSVRHLNLYIRLVLFHEWISSLFLCISCKFADVWMAPPGKRYWPGPSLHRQAWSSSSLSSSCCSYDSILLFQWLDTLAACLMFM